MRHKKDEYRLLLPKVPDVYPSDIPPANNMVADKMKVSQQTLVSEVGSVAASRFTQYTAAIIATIGGLIGGTVLAWTSPTTIPLKNGAYGFPVSDDDISWIGGSMPLGAILGCILTGMFIDTVGRKKWILFLVVPCTVGWASMIWAQSVFMFCIGRFLTGLTTGGFCLAVPIYTAEISEKEIRGTLGTYLQLQITMGILAMYVIGYYVDVYTLTIICGIIPLVFIALMAMLPETPYFHLKNQNKDMAQKSLKWFRGPHYDTEMELKLIQDTIDKDEEDKIPFTEAFQTTAAIRGLIIGLGVMFFQQFSGCNAVIFYTTSIFQASGSAWSSSLSTIVVGTVSVIATWLATLIVDKLGRRILLLFSIVMMSLCSFLLGLYFYMKMDTKTDVSNLGWLPVSSLSGYIISFSLGFGPIPWMLMGEIFPSQIRGSASSIACLFNWFCVFLITKFFPSFTVMFGIGKTFWFFGLCCVLGIFYVYFLVPETKGKTLNEIQEMLGGSEKHQRNQSKESNEVSKVEVVNEYTAKVKL